MPDAGPVGPVFNPRPVILADQHQGNAGPGFMQVGGQVQHAGAAFLHSADQHQVIGLLAEIRLRQRGKRLRHLCNHGMFQVEFPEVFGVDFPPLFILLHHQEPFSAQRAGFGLDFLHLQRKADPHLSAFPGGAVNPDFAFHRIHQPTDNAHSQAGAFNPGNGGAVDPLKGLKNPFQELFAHTDAVVPAGKIQQVPFRSRFL